jgi:NADPH:quinone reductase-like Zn-dependent oxidoreductase
VGKDVTRFKEGDHVFGWTSFSLGAYAEYKCLSDKGVLAMKPPGMSYEEAATLVVGGLDAAYFIRKADIRSGQRVLINGAGGSIGTYAVQIAKHFGAYVTAVDSAEKLDMLRSIGADQVIDYKREDFTRRRDRYDVIFDVIGKSSVGRGAQLLTPNGLYLMGNPSMPARMRGRWMAMTSSKQVVHWASRSASEHAEEVNFLKELIEAGRIKAVIDKCYPLEQIAEAHKYVDAGHKKGHVVITVGEANATEQDNILNNTADNTLVSIPALAK